MDEAAELARAQAAYDAGDFRRAREHAARLLSARDAAVRAQARRLHAALWPDRVEVAVILGCLAGLIAITWWYLL